MNGCHDAGRTVSGEPNIHSGSINNAEQFSIISLSIRSTV